jgi:hypothetical protein
MCDSKTSLSALAETLDKLLKLGRGRPSPIILVCIYSRTRIRSLSRDQRIRDFLSGKTY